MTKKVEKYNLALHYLSGWIQGLVERGSVDKVSAENIFKAVNKKCGFDPGSDSIFKVQEGRNNG